MFAATRNLLHFLHGRASATRISNTNFRVHYLSTFLRSLFSAERNKEVLEIAALHFQVILVLQVGFLQADLVLTYAQVKRQRSLSLCFAINIERRSDGIGRYLDGLNVFGKRDERTGF